jgi:hypothetical protein
MDVLDSLQANRCYSVLKVPRNRLESPERGWEGGGIALHSFDLGTLEGVEWSAPRPGHFTPGKHKNKPDDGNCRNM